MVTCQNCGNQVNDGMRFCMKCGHEVTSAAGAQPPQSGYISQPAQTCPKCGALITPGASFCMGCGFQLGASAAQVGAGFGSGVSAAPVYGREAPPQGAPPQGVTPQGVAQQGATPQGAASYTANPYSVNPYGQNSAYSTPYSSSSSGGQAQQFSGPAQAQQYAGYAPQGGVASGGASQSGVAEGSTDASGAAADGLRKKGLSPIILIAGGAVVLVGIVIAAIFLINGAISGGGVSSDENTSGDYIAYIKDNEFSVAGVNSLAAFEASEDLLPYGAGGYTESALYRLVQINKNASTVFFPDRIDGGTRSYSLYQRSVSGGGKNVGDAVRVDTDVRGVYKASEDGKTLLYVRGDDRNLFIKSGNDERVKIESDVTGFMMNKAGNRIYYTQAAEDGGSAGTIYYKNGNDTPERVDSVSKIEKVSEDFQTVYYLKEGTLYSKKAGEQKVKIAGGVESVVRTYDSGEMYYLCEDTDDEDNTVTVLCYNDGKGEAASESRLGQTEDDYNFIVTTNPERAALVYIADSSSDSGDEDSSGEPESEYRIVIKNTDSALDIAESMSRPTYTVAGDKLYYMDEYDEGGDIGNLYCVEFDDTGFKPPVSITEDVAGFGVTVKGVLYYYQDLNRAGTSADLYVDGELADSDVKIDSASEVNGTGKLIYYTDYNQDRGRGTLKIYENKKAALIADDVDSLAVMDGKNIAYLVIEGSSSSGELLRYNGSKSGELIDSDVSFMIPVYITGMVAERVY